MLKALVRAALRRRGVTIALAALLFGYGLYALRESRLDVFPEFAPPMAVVHTEAPGLSAEQVETLVTQPIENALGGAVGLRTMRSKSLPGLSVVSLVFGDGVDVDRARQFAAEQLAAVAGTLPRGVKAPVLLPLTSSTSVAMEVALTSTRPADDRSAMALYDLARWTVRPRLLGLPGVGDVIVFGGERREWQIDVDPRRLQRYGLAIGDVLAAARRATGVRGAGHVDTANQRIVVHSEGQLTSAGQLADVTIVDRSAGPVRLGDVARVRVAPAPAVGAAAVGSKPAVMLIVESQYGADPLAITRSVDRALAGLAPALAREQVRVHPDVFRAADFITTAVGHLRLALLLGGALVVVVLFLFLLDLRTAFISATAIPLSLLSAVIVLRHLGVSLNTMTLGGLAIALGEVVDDAIVDVENIFRRLRENRSLAQPLPAARVVLKASLEVRSAVVYASFIVVLVFLPVLTLSGVAGRLFAPLGLAYVLAVLASLAVALTLTPALALALLGRGALRLQRPRMIEALERRYRRLLAAVERRHAAVVVGVALLCVAAAAALPFFSASFIPDLKEGAYTVHMALAPGSSLAESMRVGAEVTAALQAIPGVRSVAQRAGRASGVFDPVDVNDSEFEVALARMSGPQQERTLARMQAVLARFPGLTTSINTFLKERIDETISGVTAPVVVDLYGDDLDVLDRKAQQVAQLLASLPGAIGVSVPMPPGTPQLSVRLRPERLARWGFRSVDVLDALHAALQGVTVAQVFEGSEVHDVTLRLDFPGRADPARLGELPLRNDRGVTVPLGELADITQSEGRAQIAHRNGQRVQTVTASVTGRAVGDFVRQAQAAVAREIRFPRGSYAVFAGEAQAQRRSQRELLVHAGLAGAGVVLLLWMALRRARLLLLVLANLPFALVGGVLVVLATGADLGLGGLVGFVTLFGITLRNSIMLVSHYEHLVSLEGRPWNAETATRGACERLLPILMTALVTGLGLLPLALTSGAPGNEIEGPMAAVILGGLVTSTALNLLVLPVLALRFGRFGGVARPA